MNTRAITKVKRNASHSAIPARNLAPQRRFEVPQLVEEAAASAERLRSGLQAEPRFRYDFSQTPVDFSTQAPAQQVTESCPLALTSPRACPFGGACHSCPPRVQTKLTVGKFGDKYEQEADRAADAIMRTPGLVAEREVELREKKEQNMQVEPAGGPITDSVQMQLENHGRKLGEMTHSPTDIRHTTPEIETRIGHKLRIGGQALDSTNRALMEKRFGEDFSRVLVHTSSSSSEIARELNARAFTVGEDIFFNSTHYSSETNAGLRLLAHELAHVVQQRRTQTPLLQMTRLLDFRGSPLFPTDAEIRETNEYRAYMNPKYVWQTELELTNEQALRACRLILRALKDGERVNWKARAREFALRAQHATGSQEVETCRGWSLYNHGYWCGSLSDCEVCARHCDDWQDEMDWCCMRHDQKYDSVGVSSTPAGGGVVDMDSEEGRVRTWRIDEEFAICLRTARTESNFYRNIAIWYFSDRAREGRTLEESRSSGSEK